MANFILDDLKKVFRGDNPLSKIIVINAIVFLVYNLLGRVFPFYSWFAIPGEGIDFILKPWTIVTYMFLHAGFFHILFNMLWLHWMGRLLVEYLNNRRFLTIYFVGGIVGGLAYVLAYNVLSMTGGPSMGSGMLGASAGVMAVVIAVATLLPDYVVHLLFLGPVRMKYVGLGILVLTSLLDFSVNMGGKLAHLGGALVGYLFVKQLQSGSDWSQAFFGFLNVFNPAKKKKMKVVSKQPQRKTNTQKPRTKNEQERVDAILDKISQSGYDSLNADEKEFLFKASNKK